MFEVITNKQNYVNDRSKKLIKKFEKTTLGNFIICIKKAFNYQLNEKVDLIFEPALKKRNYLIHEFFIIHRNDIINNDKIDEMVDELNQIIEIIEPAAKFAQETTSKLFAGFTENFPQDAIDEVMKQTNHSPNK